MHISGLFTFATILILLLGIIEILEILQQKFGNVFPVSLGSHMKMAKHVGCMSNDDCNHLKPRDPQATK